jgi:hypothetical protein
MRDWRVSIGAKSTESTVDSRQSTGKKLGVRSLLDSRTEGVDHPRDLVHFGQQVLRDGRSRIAKVTTQKEQVTGLRQGSLGDIQEAGIVLTPLTLGTLGDICGHGNDRSSQLRHETETLRRRKAGRQPVNVEHQSMAPLPDFELLKVFQ